MTVRLFGMVFWLSTLPRRNVNFKVFSLSQKCDVTRASHQYLRFDHFKLTPTKTTTTTTIMTSERRSKKACRLPIFLRKSYVRQPLSDQHVRNSIVPASIGFFLFIHSRQTKCVLFFLLRTYARLSLNHTFLFLITPALIDLVIILFLGFCFLTRFLFHQFVFCIFRYRIIILRFDII